MTLRPDAGKETPAMSFVDMREWIARLDKEGELRRITAEVDWDRELGAIARRVLEKKGPALLFENIKGYRTGRCTRLFASGLGSVGRLALALGFPKDVSNRELVQHVMKTNRQTIAPRVVATGPVKDVVIPGKAVDQKELDTEVERGTTTTPDSSAASCGFFIFCIVQKAASRSSGNPQA